MFYSINIHKKDDRCQIEFFSIDLQIWAECKDKNTINSLISN